jgi:hypothetical protein
MLGAPEKCTKYTNTGERQLMEAHKTSTYTCQQHEEATRGSKILVAAPVDQQIPTPVVNQSCCRRKTMPGEGAPGSLAPPHQSLCTRNRVDLSIAFLVQVQELERNERRL